jgi:hypothetical protein
MHCGAQGSGGQGAYNGNYKHGRYNWTPLSNDPTPTQQPSLLATADDVIE